MAVTVTLTVAPAEPAKGATVTATYAVSGNDPVPPQTAVVSGDASVGEEVIHVSTALTLPGTPAKAEAFDVPTCPGLTFKATADPHVFTAVVA